MRIKQNYFSVVLPLGLLIAFIIFVLYQSWSVSNHYAPENYSSKKQYIAL